MTGTLAIYGNHRGGRSFVDALAPSTGRLYDPYWTFADPKDRRAQELASHAVLRFPWLSPRPLSIDARRALVQAGPGDSLVLTLDTVGDTLDTLRARTPGHRVSFQLVGRGPGGLAGVHLGVQGTIVPGDAVAQGRAEVLLAGLRRVSEDASSRALTALDPLTAAGLQPMRRAVSLRTAAHLAYREPEPRDLPGGPLSMLLNGKVYPLAPIVAPPSMNPAERQQLALEALGSVPAEHLTTRPYSGKLGVVALIASDAPRVDFLTVLERGAQRRVDGRLTLTPAPAIPSQSTVSQRSTVFTD